MPFPRPALRLSIALILCCAASALAPHEARAERGAAIVPESVARVESNARQASLNRSPEWLAFRRRHGDWQATWNEHTQTPHRAFGEGVSLPGFAGDAASADRAVRGFVADHPEMFAGAPELETMGAYHAGQLWFVRYQQRIDGLPVLFADWEFRVFDDGRLVGFGADAFRSSDYHGASVIVAGAAAREAAKEGLGFNPATDRVVGEEPQYLFPNVRGSSVELRRVYEVVVHTARPRGEWLTYVDAENGSVLYRMNRVRGAISGTVTGFVHTTGPFDGQLSLPFKSEWVNVGAAQATTNAAGSYTAAAAGTVNVNAQMVGPYCAVTRQDGGANASFSTTVIDPATVNIGWTSGNSHDAERDAFWNVNFAHDYVKGIDPTYTANDVQIPVNVIWPDDECAAYWEPIGQTLNFVASGATCPNTATMPDIIYHEYDHSVTDKLYSSHGASLGLQNQSLAEALADAGAALVMNNPYIGKGFFGPGTILRTVLNTVHWPEDASANPQQTGLALAGAIWDLSENVTVGLTVTRQLTHFAKYGLADDVDTGVAFSEYFIDFLQADDNDGNLANGTPHFTAIVNAFNSHGVGTNYFLGITHTPVADQATNGPYPVSTQVQYTGPVGSLSSVKLHYSTNYVTFASKIMTPTGNPDEWGAEVPAQSGGIVRYYIEAVDSYGGSRVAPAGAPARDVYIFIAGPGFPLIINEMESSPGWTIGATGDSAVTGIWARLDPLGTQCQPEDDHTPAGVLCYVTANGDTFGFPGQADVDGGKTTLVTNAFDPTGWVDPVISYYRWYSNDTGDAPGEDTWRVDISNNGGSTWSPVESTTKSELAWRRIVFFIGDKIPITNNMKMRFIAEDALSPSLVEAAVDDWSLFAFPPGVGVEPRTPARGLSLAAPSPNPTRGITAFRIHLPVAGRVTMVVYDINGRSIRTLVDGDLTAGEHALSWDGLDQRGRQVASGPYFIRISQAGQKASQPVVMIK